MPPARPPFPPKSEPEFTGPRRRERFRPIGRVALKTCRKALSKRGPGDETLLEAWPEIAGPALAPYTFPIHLNRRTQTLTVRVAAGRALNFQYEEPQILGRITTYCGARLVDRLKIVQGPLPQPRTAAPPKPQRALTPPEERFVQSAVTGIEDEALKAALLRLGASLAAKRAPPS